MAEIKAMRFALYQRSVVIVMHRGLQEFSDEFEDYGYCRPGTVVPFTLTKELFHVDDPGRTRDRTSRNGHSVAPTFRKIFLQEQQLGAPLHNRQFRADYYFYLFVHVDLLK